jgi:uncharacterized protein (DUF1697 family)
MKSYISFLRGVNMAGHNSIKMTELALSYENMGFENVVTHIQSGNVVFNLKKDLSDSELVLKIEKGILKKFNYDIPVMIRTPLALKQIISSCPFLDEHAFDPSKLAVIFLHNKPSESQIQKVSDVSYPPDKFAIIEREVFVYCPNGFGRTKLYTNFFEKKMGVIGTGRNWNTIKALIDLAEKS